MDMTLENGISGSVGGTITGGCGDIRDIRYGPMGSRTSRSDGARASTVPDEIPWCPSGSLPVTEPDSRSAMIALGRSIGTRTSLLTAFRSFLGPNVLVPLVCGTTRRIPSISATFLSDPPVRSRGERLQPPPRSWCVSSLWRRRCTGSSSSSNGTWTSAVPR